MKKHRATRIRAGLYSYRGFEIENFESPRSLANPGRKWRFFEGEGITRKGRGSTFSLGRAKKIVDGLVDAEISAEVRR